MKNANLNSIGDKKISLLKMLKDQSSNEMAVQSSEVYHLKVQNLEFFPYFQGTRPFLVQDLPLVPVCFIIMQISQLQSTFFFCFICIKNHWPTTKPLTNFPLLAIKITSTGNNNQSLYWERKREKKDKWNKQRLTRKGTTTRHQAKFPSNQNIFTLKAEIDKFKILKPSNGETNCKRDTPSSWKQND